MVLFNYVVCSLEFYLYFLFLSIFFKEKPRTATQKTFVTLLCALGLLLFNMLDIVALNPVVAFTLVYIGGLYSYDASKGALLVICSFDIALALCCEFVVAGFMTLTLKEHALDILDTTAGWIVAGCCSKSMNLLVVFLCKIILQRRNQVSYGMSVIILYPVMSVYIMYSMLYFDLYLPKDSVHAVWISSIYILLLLVNIVVFYLYEKQQKMRQLETELQEAEKYRQHQNELIQINQGHMNQLATLTHDFKNHLISIQSMLSDDSPQLQSYLETLTGEISEKSKNSHNYCNNPAINGILSHIKQECIKSNITFNIEIEYKDLEFLSFSDVCAIFGNALDNSLRACQTLREQNLPASMEVIVMRHKHLLTIGFNNNRDSKEVIRRKGEHYLSSKENRTLGYGLRSLSSAVEKNNGSVDISYDKDQFSIAILLPINK